MAWLKPSIALRSPDSATIGLSFFSVAMASKAFSSFLDSFADAVAGFGTELIPQLAYRLDQAVRHALTVGTVA